MKQKFSLSKLGMVDMGKIAAAVDAEIANAVRDLADRPGDASKRSVLLQIDLVPQKNDAGVCEEAMVDFKIQSKLPPRQSRTYSMGVNPTGGLIFNPESPDSIRQNSLDEGQEGGKPQ